MDAFPPPINSSVVPPPFSLVKVTKWVSHGVRCQTVIPLPTKYIGIYNNVYLASKPSCVFEHIYYLPALLANVQAVFITGSLLDNYIF